MLLFRHVCGRKSGRTHQEKCTQGAADAAAGFTDGMHRQSPILPRHVHPVRVLPAKRCTQSTRCTHPSSAWLWKRTKAGCESTKTPETSPQRCRSAKVTVRRPVCCLTVTDCGADVSRVVAFIILNNLKQIMKTWRKQLGDETLYLQFQTAMSVI